MFGTVSAYNNVISILILFTNFGFSEYILVNSGSKEKLHLNTRNLIFVSVLCAIIILSLSSIFPFESWLIFSLLWIKIYFENALALLLLAFFQVDKKMKVISAYNIFNSLLIFIVLGVLYYLKLGLLHYLISIVLIYLATTLFLIGRHGLNPLYSLSLKRKTRIYFWIKEMRYYGFSMITIPVYMMLPSVIGAISLKKPDFAIFQSAFSLTNIILLVSTSYLQSEYPKYLYSESIAELKERLFKTVLKVFFLNAFIIVFFLFLGKDILLVVYKKEIFQSAFFPLLILLGANMLFVFASAFSVPIVINKQQKLKTKLHLEFIFISLVLSIFLIQLMGIVGICITYLLLYTYVFFRYFTKFNNITKLKNE